MQAKETMKTANAMRLVTIASFVFAFCFSSPAFGDDTAKVPPARAASLEDLLSNIVQEGTVALLSSLDVKKAIEVSLWETVLSPESLSREELTQFDGSVDGQKGILLVQLIVPGRSELAEKHKLAPLAEGASIQVSYDVLKRKVERPLASIYYVDARQAQPRVQLAAFFVFDAEKRTWSRVPSSPLR